MEENTVPDFQYSHAKATPRNHKGRNVAACRCTAAKTAPDTTADATGKPDDASAFSVFRPFTSLPHHEQNRNNPILNTNSSTTGAKTTANTAYFAFTGHATPGLVKSFTRSWGGGSNPKSNATCSEHQASPIAASVIGANHFNASFMPISNFIPSTLPKTAGEFQRPQPERMYGLTKAFASRLLENVWLALSHSSAPGMRCARHPTSMPSIIGMECSMSA